MNYAVIGTDVRTMFGSIADRYDITNSILSLGIHHWWRRAFIKLVPASKTSRVLDLCSGTGALLPLLRKRCGMLVGSDFCLPMLKRARAEQPRRVPPDCSLLQSDALSLPFADESFDAVTVAFGVRNLEDLGRGLEEMHRVLRPGGVLAILEFGQPRGIMAPLFSVYSRLLMPLIGGMITGNRAAYSYLPETARRFPCGDQFMAIAASHGFAGGSTRALTGGIAHVYRLTRASPRHIR